MFAHEPIYKSTTLLLDESSSSARSRVTIGQWDILLCSTFSLMVVFELLEMLNIVEGAMALLFFLYLFGASLMSVTVTVAKTVRKQWLLSSVAFFTYAYHLIALAFLVIYQTRMSSPFKSFDSEWRLPAFVRLSAHLFVFLFNIGINLHVFVNEVLLVQV